MRARYIRQDNIKTVFEEIACECLKLIQLIQDGNKRRVGVKILMYILALYETGNHFNI